MASNGLISGAVALPLSLASALMAIGLAPAGAADRSDAAEKEIGTTHPYAGVWVTADGYIRHELLPGGRYVEARGDRERAYEGSYWIVDDHIEYKDDTGFTADGDFRDGILYHAGMVLYRRDSL